MARLFVSHSSVDNAKAMAFGDWLTREGFDDFFLDFDPDRGIAAGERWEGALHRAADRCEAVIFLVSRAWLASQWCAKEFDIAVKLSKRIFGVLVDATPIEDVPARYRTTWQFVSLDAGTDHEMFRVSVPPAGEEAHVTFSRDGLKRLKAGLFAAGLDPKFFTWPPADRPDRSPYPGLSALEGEDAGIFFGREAALVQALDKLRDLAGRAPPRLFSILGASGAGKSSFLRAGLWPRLARDDRHFLPLPPIRPMRAAITGDHGLVSALLRATTARDLKLSRAEIVGLTADPRGFVDLLGRLARSATVAALPGEIDPKPPAVVIAVDQAEELFPLDDRPEAARLLDLLARAVETSEITVIVVFTIRTEAYDHLQGAAATTALRQETFSLQPMPLGAYQTIIEGPAARLVGTRRALTIEPALTEALLRDIEAGGGRDALPLLAFTLERLYLEHGGKGRLTRADYETSGGVAGSIAAAVETVLAAGAAADLPTDRDGRLTLLRRGLIPWLASIDPTTGEPRRNAAWRSALPAESLPLIDRMIEVRLLRTDGSEAGDRPPPSTPDERPPTVAATPRVRRASTDVPVEMTHEALLRQWPVMVGWLAADRTRLEALAGVRQATRDWIGHARAPGWLAHAAGRLEDAEVLLARPDLAAGLDEDHHAYLAACRTSEDARRNAELDHARAMAEAAEAARESAEAARVAAEKAERAASAQALAESLGRRRARSGAAVAFALAVVASGAAWFGFDRANYAEGQRLEADAARETAETQKARADKALAAATKTANGLIFELAQKFRNRTGVEVGLVRDILGAARKLQKTLEAGGEATPELRRSSAAALVELAQTLLDAGDTGGARAAVDDALRTFEWLADADPGNPRAQRDLGVGYDRRGGLAVRAGDDVAAKMWFEKSLAISERLASTDLGNTRAQRDLAIGYDRLGDLAVRGGDSPTAREWFEKSLAIAERLASAEPGNTGDQRSLALTYIKLGNLTVWGGNDAAARTWYEKGLAIQEGLARADPGNAEAQRDLAVTYITLGDRAVRRGDNTAAKVWFEKYMDISERLASVDLGNAKSQRDLSLAYNRLGVLAIRSGDGAAAKAWFERDLAICEKLASADPGNVEAQRDLAVSYNRLGDAAVRSNDGTAAKTWFEKELAIRERLASAAPGNTEAQRNLAISCGALGNVAAQAGDGAAASTWFGKAADLLRKGLPAIEAADTKETDAPGPRTADELNMIAWGLLFTGDFHGALAATERGHAIAPANLLVEGNRAHALMFLGRDAEARTLYLSHRDEPLGAGIAKTWRQAVLDDFDLFRKVGLGRALMAEIEAAFAGGTP